MIASIHYDGLLCWNVNAPLATKEQYELADRAVGSIFEVLKPKEIVEIEEGLFVLDNDLDVTPCLDDIYSIYLSAAFEHGKSIHKDAPKEHHAAYANSVVYLITGISGGYGGPSCREHAVAWAVAGEKTGNEIVPFNKIMPPLGKWKYEQAVAFADLYCYGELTQLHYKCFQDEYCFDDSEIDIKNLKKFSGESENP